MIKKNRVGLQLGLVVGLLTILSACASDPGPADEALGENEGLGSEQFVQLTDAELEEFEIEIQTAAPGTLHVGVTFPGEVRVNRDRFARIVPRVSGVVHSVYNSVGDTVRAGDILAVLDSRELADLKSDYLADLERLELAESTFRREEKLYAKKISSEQEYLETKRTLAEMRIALRSVRQKLLALGFTEGYLESLPDQHEHALVHYQITTPFSGIVVERHISQGERVTEDAEAFAVADLRTVWVDLSVYQKDLDLVREGMKVNIVTTSGKLRARGTVNHVQPIIGEETRTAVARIVLKNTDGRWKPGMFVNGTIEVDAVLAPIVVPKSALITLKGQTVVFVRSDEGIGPQPVTLGRENETEREVTAGLDPGMRYVARGGFAVKAELEKGEFGDGDED